MHAETYHAHIYFLPEQTPEAARLHEQARQGLAEHAEVLPLVPRPVGPHLRPMFELNFAGDDHAFVVHWLEGHHGALPVLVHPCTGDDPRDHGPGAVWLGERLPLDESKLDPSPQESGRA